MSAMTQTTLQRLDDARQELHDIRREREDYAQTQWSFSKGTLAHMQDYWHEDHKMDALLQDCASQHELNVKKVLGSYDEGEAALKQSCKKLQDELEEQQAQARRRESDNQKA
jgi:hypothetical protein